MVVIYYYVFIFSSCYYVVSNFLDSQKRLYQIIIFFLFAFVKGNISLWHMKIFSNFAIGTIVSIFLKSIRICIQKALSVLHKSIYLSLHKKAGFSFFVLQSQVICKQSENYSWVLPNKTYASFRNTIFCTSCVRA